MTFDPNQPEQIVRFGRQLQLRQIGANGQRRLGSSRAVVVGIGGLGCPAATYLVAAGIGAIHLVDGDVVEPSNLNRQVLFTASDVGSAKASVAAKRLAEQGTGCQITWTAEQVDRANAESLFFEADVVLDATDNFPARFLISDACWLLGVPLVQAAVTQFSGQLATYLPDRNPCYRCFFPQPPLDGLIPGCREAGVLGATVGSVGCMQALEAIKLIVGGPDKTLAGHLLVLDLWTMSSDRIIVPANPDCPLCGPRAWIREMLDAGTVDVSSAHQT